MSFEAGCLFSRLLSQYTSSSWSCVLIYLFLFFNVPVPYCLVFVLKGIISRSLFFLVCRNLKLGKSRSHCCWAVLSAVLSDSRVCVCKKGSILSQTWFWALHLLIYSFPLFSLHLFVSLCFMSGWSKVLRLSPIPCCVHTDLGLWDLSSSFTFCLLTFIARNSSWTFHSHCSKHKGLQHTSSHRWRHWMGLILGIIHWPVRLCSSCFYVPSVHGCVFCNLHLCVCLGAGMLSLIS